MKVYAYSPYGPQPHLAWSDVDAWLVSGPILTLWRNREAEVISLPRNVIGLHDDGPHAPAPPGKYDAPKKREDVDHGANQVEWHAPERRYGRQRAGRPGK